MDDLDKWDRKQVIDEAVDRYLAPTKEEPIDRQEEESGSSTESHTDLKVNICLDRIFNYARSRCLNAFWDREKARRQFYLRVRY